jgi:phosphoserine phosphatase RsbU/P
MTYGDPAKAVTVSTAVSEAEAVIRVHNWGKPIPPALMPTIFEPLSRGEEAGESRSLGLGLYIVNQIAKAHHGDVVVTSDEESGTTFTARLRPQAGGATAA